MNQQKGATLITVLIILVIITLIGTIAMSTALGLKMLTLTNYFSFSDNVATNYLLVINLY